MNPEDQFIKDTKKHTIIIHKDDGIYRHLECSRNGSSIFSFEIMTYRGHLLVCGDMGTFVFSRDDDMFDFFRHDQIDPEYWAEKCVAGETEEWSQERFIEAVREYGDDDLTDSAAGCENEHEAMQFICDNYEDLPDIHECRMTSYRYHYLWSLHGIIWAIKRYDEMT